MTVAYEEVIYAVEDGVATITINRPEQLNALTDLTQAEIRHALGQSESNPDVVGTVLTGAGRGFCSGVDMNALGGMSEAGKRLGNSYEHLQANPGNPDNDPNYQSSPTYFLGLRKPLIAAITALLPDWDSATQPSAICALWTKAQKSLPPLRHEALSRNTAQAGCCPNWLAPPMLWT